MAVQHPKRSPNGAVRRIAVFPQSDISVEIQLVHTICSGRSPVFHVLHTDHRCNVEQDMNADSIHRVSFFSSLISMCNKTSCNANICIQFDTWQYWGNNNNGTVEINWELFLHAYDTANTKWNIPKIHHAQFTHIHTHSHTYVGSASNIHSNNMWKKERVVSSRARIPVPHIYT